MSALRVTVDGTSTVLSPGRTYTVGRTPEADVTLTRPSCSRRHAELHRTDDGWEVVDVGSQHGTYVGGERVERAVLTERTTVWFSSPEEGTAVVLEPVTIDRPGEAGVLPDPALQATVLPGGLPRSDASLVLRWDGRDHFFGRGAPVRIGRDERADLVVSHPSVSRHHATVSPDGDGWRFDDESRSGSYVNGSRVQRLTLSAPASIRLGDPTTGAELLVTPVLPPGARSAAESSARARRVLVAAGAAVVVLLLVVVLALQLAGDDAGPAQASATSDAGVQGEEPDDGLTQDELQRAKLATVMLTAESQDGRGRAVAWGGSGSLITADGLILTNAHVAAPQAVGLAELYGPSDMTDPEYVLVSLTRESDDLPAAPAYRAQVVVADGRLDIALVQIVATADGEPLTEELDLPTVPVGDSADLSTGDDLTVLGFPAISDSGALSVTRGVVSTFIPDAELDSERAEIDTDARISPGNSGGMAIDDDGELIGVPSAYRQEAGAPIVSGRIRPIDLVKPLIDEVEGT
jgi:putative serine protease PepD